jgi:ABC-type glycerol-3-phosphate transport system permease component
MKYAILFFFAFVTLVPIYWVVATSFKSDAFITAWPPQWFPDPISLRSYERAFSLLPIGRFFLNSVIIAVALMVSNVVLCSLAGYTLARKKFRGRDKLFALILSSMMIPLHVRIIPMYMMSIKLGLQDTYQGIILPIAATGFGIFLMRQFFLTLPVEIEDAARVDGCSDWGVIFRIVIPVSRPAITSLAIFALVWSLEDFLWPLIITSDVMMRPLPVGITLFLGLVVYEWGPVMATTAITILPMVIVYLFLQRGFIQGLTAGAVKG